MHTGSPSFGQRTSHRDAAYVWRKNTIPTVTHNDESTNLQGCFGASGTVNVVKVEGIGKIWNPEAVGSKAGSGSLLYLPT